MYKNHWPDDKDFGTYETVEQAIARGVKVQKVAPKASGIKKKSANKPKVIDKTAIPKELQHLLK